MFTMRRRLTTAVLVAALLMACAALPAGASAAPALAVGGSVQQVYVTGAQPGERVALVNRRGATVAVLPAGALGGADLPRRQARARISASGPPPAAAAASHAVTVLPDRSAPPSTKIYDQHIPRSGYGYLTTRDGTKLAIDVRLPAGPGPYPTLVEYSGYGYADPAGAESGISPVATLLGFAVVDVNMRGTGCSGGAFSFFEPLQNLDGYDVIETVAHQPWVLHHKVGMIGVSYGGISQLFVAATDPPDLAAIAPLSVIDDTATTLYPGGILNTGFAVPFAQARDFDAEPASPGHGEAWALQRIRGGDRTCRANQVLHPEAVNEVAETERQPLLRAVGGEPTEPRHVRAQDPRAGVPRVSVDRRADRGSLPGARRALHRDAAEVVHVHQRRLTSTHSIRPPRCAGTTSCHCSSPTGYRT